MMPETFSLRIERSFAASRARVFRAFTERAPRSQWLRPGDDWTVPVTELDPHRDDQEQGWPAFLDPLGKLLASR